MLLNIHLFSQSVSPSVYLSVCPVVAHTLCILIVTFSAVPSHRLQANADSQITCHHRSLWTPHTRYTLSPTPHPTHPRDILCGLDIITWSRVCPIRGGFIYLFISIVYLFIRSFICVCDCLFVYLFICLFIYFIIYLFILIISFLFIRSFICFFDCSFFLSFFLYYLLMLMMLLFFNDTLKT